MALDINPLRTVDNATFLDAIRNDSSLEYQNRIPSATIAGVQDTVRSLEKFRPLRNEFIDALVNRIGLVIARNTSWTNPMADFKRGLLEFGDTIEELQVGLLNAHVYDPDREYMEHDLFGTERPEVQSNFHRVNRQNFYKVTVNNALLSRAFLETNGLSVFVEKLMAAPSTSDQVDEFLLMTSLFKEYESNGGFYHAHVSDVADIGSSADDAKYALRKMRAMADTLKFVSTKYNAAHMPTFANQDELCLFVTPEFNAAIDVEALAGAFNVDRANMHGRVYPIPVERFDIQGCQAIMTVKDFFVVADQTFETTSQWNPAALQNNYFLHHWEVISASRFVPAVMFTTGADDEVITVAYVVSSVGAIVFEPTEDGTVPTNVNRGDMVALDASAVTSPTGGQAGVLWSISGNASNATFITSTGVLHIAKDESASAVVVTATSAYIDPARPQEPRQSVTLSVPIVGPVLALWPAVQGVVTAINVGEVSVPAVAGTFAYTVHVPVGTVVKASDVYVEGTGDLETNVTLTGNVTSGYTAVITVDPLNGTALTYTITISEG